MATDKVKVQRNNIIAAAVDAFAQNKDDPKYDFQPAAKSMVEEAYELGKKVGQGKLPDPDIAK